MITKDARNILVADDSLFFRIKLSDVLIEAGHKVRLVKDGREAIEEIKADPDEIDLLILDLQMPHVDGFGALRWIKENGLEDKFPVLVVTGVYESAGTIRDLRELGAKGFMSKSISPEEIVTRVNVLLFVSKAKAGVKRKRMNLFMPVDFSVGDITNTGMVVNLSEGGFFFHSDVEIPVGAILNLKFSLPGSTDIIHAKGAVRWTPEESKKKSIFYGYGLMFVMLPATDRQAIRDFIASKEDVTVDLAP
ncbi:MAG: response regulator [Deltaproteobacteria bacterium]|nr:response regulator [Deltaproteobacteria bacterium]